MDIPRSNIEKFNEVINYFNTKVNGEKIPIFATENFQLDTGEIEVNYHLEPKHSHNGDYCVSINIVYKGLFDNVYDDDKIKRVPNVKKGIEAILSKRFSQSDEQQVLGELILSGNDLPSDFRVWFYNDEILTFSKQYFEQVSTNPDYQSFINNLNMDICDNVRNVIDFMIDSYANGLKLSAESEEDI